MQSFSARFRKLQNVVLSLETDETASVLEGTSFQCEDVCLRGLQVPPRSSNRL